MKTLTFDNGDAMPALGLGTWKSGPGEVGAAVVAALELGYRHIDCAWIYGNEAEVGQALHECLRRQIVARDDVWITSKLWCDAHAPEHVEPALRETLEALRLEYLDLYLMHWPIAVEKGIWIPQSVDEMIALEDLPVETTWRAMERLVDRGLCRHIGVSNFSVKKLSSLHSTARIKPAVNQVEMHPYLKQGPLIEYCREHRIALTAYSPFGSRDRAPALKQPDEPDLFVDSTIVSIADAHGATPAQVILAWLLSRGVSTIPKSVNRARLTQNLAAQSLELTSAEQARIDRIDHRYRFVSGQFWALPGGPYTVETLWDETSDGRPIS